MGWIWSGFLCLNHGKNISASQTDSQWSRLRWRWVSERSRPCPGGGSQRIWLSPLGSDPCACNSQQSEEFWMVFGCVHPPSACPGRWEVSGESEPAAVGRAALVDQRAVQERGLSLVAAARQPRGHGAQLLVAPPEQEGKGFVQAPLRSQRRRLPGWDLHHRLGHRDKPPCWEPPPRAASSPPAATRGSGLAAAGGRSLGEASHTGPSGSG